MKPPRAEHGIEDDHEPQETTPDRPQPPPFDVTQSIEQAQSGSSEALGELMELCRSYLLRIANDELQSGLRPKAGASDLVQESLLQAQQGLQGFRGRSEAELLAWLRRILLNRMANFRREFQATEKRQLSRERSLNGDSGLESIQPTVAGAGPSPSSLCARKEQEEGLSEAIARLPAGYQRILRLRYWERRSFREIGQCMNCSPDAARKLCARAIQRLQCEMDQPPDERTSKAPRKPR